MNRPRRPVHGPPRRRPGGPPQPSTPQNQQPRRRTPLDYLPAGIEPPLKVLGTGVDRHTLMGGAQPIELAVVQGFAREIDEVYQKFNGRFDDFWTKNPKLLDQVRKMDEVLAGIQARKNI